MDAENERAVGYLRLVKPLRSLYLSYDRLLLRSWVFNSNVLLGNMGPGIK